VLKNSKAIAEAITGPFSADLVRETLTPIIQKAIGTVKDTATTAVKGAIETAKQTATDTAKGALQTAKQTIQKAVQPTINEAERGLQSIQETTQDLAERGLEQVSQSAGDMADMADIASMEFAPTLTNLADETAMTAVDALPASESLLASFETRGISQAAQVGDTITSLPDLPGLDQLAPMRELMGRTSETNAEWLERAANEPPETPPEIGEQTAPTIEDAGQQSTQEIGQAGEQATQELGEEAGAEAGAEAGDEAATEVGSTVAKGIGGDLENLAEGSSILDEIPGGAVVTGILALGSIFAGIFGHANEAASINPSAQFGIGF